MKRATAISWDSFNHYFIYKTQFIGLSKFSWLKSVPLYVGSRDLSQNKIGEGIVYMVLLKDIKGVHNK